MDMPQTGGSWTRDPKTGALRRTGDAAAEVSPDVAPTDPTSTVAAEIPTESTDVPVADPDGADAPKTPKGRAK